jgi:hypothetical protein
MKWFSLFIILAYLSTLGGCSRLGKTAATIEVSIAKFESELGGSAAGGVYLYGYGPNGKSFGQVMSGTTFSQTLPNGNWSFYALAWEGNGQDNLTGAVRCAQTAVNLTGSETNLSLSLSKL